MERFDCAEASCNIGQLELLGRRGVSNEWARCRRARVQMVPAPRQRGENAESELGCYELILHHRIVEKKTFSCKNRSDLICSSLKNSVYLYRFMDISMNHVTHRKWYAAINRWCPINKRNHRCASPGCYLERFGVLSCPAIHFAILLA